MIYHDTVELTVEIDTGRIDDRGNPIYKMVTDTVPAEVFPLATEDIMSRTGNEVVSRYRVVLAPVLDIAPEAGDGLSIKWGAYDRMVAEGTVERHMMRGRLHHYELITAQVN